MHINDLNEDCQKCIFIRLSVADRVKCETVCKLWQQLVRQTLFSQTRISTKTNCDEMDKVKVDANGQLLMKIISKCPNLRSIDFTNTELNENVVKCISFGCHKLEAFMCDDSKTFNDEIVNIFLAGNYVNQLTDICLPNSKLTETGLKCLLEKCQNLKSLDISNNDCVSGELSFNSFGSCITSLNIEKCRYIREAGIRCLVSGNGTKISRLMLGSYISRNIIKYIATNMCDLSHLSIDAHYYPQSFSQQDLVIIAKLVKLELLSLKNLPLLLSSSDRTLIKILRSLPKLKHLSLSVAQISDRLLESLSNYCPLLESFNYRYSTYSKAINSELTNNGVTYFIRSKKLRQLSLRGTQIGDSIADVILANKTLVRIELFYCTVVSDQTVKACIGLAKTNFNLFIKLKLKGCKKIKHIDRTDLPSNIVIDYL